VHLLVNGQYVQCTFFLKSVNVQNHKHF